MAEAKQVPLGRELDWSEADLDALAALTPADERRSLAKATPEMRAVVTAEEAEP